MNLKAKTLIERHGFSDRDRTSPLHDEIQIWAFNNIETILNHCYGIKKFDVRFKQLEYAVVQRSHSFMAIVGFVDIYVHGYAIAGSEVKRFDLAIEVKTTIPSCGELIRQINFYKKFEHDLTWLVICSDNKFEKILSDHKIEFLTYTRPQTGPLFQ